MRSLVLAAAFVAVGALVYPTVDYERMQRSTVLVRAMYDGQQVSHGAGVLIDGGILTAGHIADSIPEGGYFEVEFYGGETATAALERMTFGGTPLKDDLALLTITETHGYPVAPIACDMPSVGSRLYVVGHPAKLRWTVSEGTVITHKNRAGYPAGAWLSTNTTIWQGNSGGPMFDAYGRVVGIVSHALSTGHGPTGHNFGASPMAVCEFLEAV